MNGNGRRNRADKPLLGAVLCCTSVPPEQRAQYAEYAAQMGAEHKLDLTSDVTHLLVGDTNTPKYQYVARERDDVQVLRPEWVEAVRECWMHDQIINFDELTKEYKVPTFAGLKICITGFDDLNFRAQLQQKVNENGGEYTGDLTKDVTHLIANSCEGKKFQYAVQWEKKIVGLKWLRDSLERGMQLDEVLYHPAKPPNEQGIGAWKRQAKGVSQIGKRPRQDQMAPEPSRKLRRSASMKLGSQNDDVWSDIVGGDGFETGNRERESLRQSKSVPAVGREKQVVDSFTGEELLGNAVPLQSRNGKQKAGFLEGKSFCIQGFDSKKAQLLAEVISQNGGTVSAPPEQLTPSQGSHDHRLSVFPYTSSKRSLSQSFDLKSLPNLVTELWIECCMNRKVFVPPEQYPIGGLLDNIPIPGFDTLVVNASGFQGIEILHVSKMLKLMGARYDEIFKSTTSVLVCENLDPNSQKVLHAQEWGVQIVRTTWLWSCIKTCQLRPFDDYLWPGSMGAKIKPNILDRQREPLQDVRKEKPNAHEENHKNDTTYRSGPEPKLSAEDILNERRLQELSGRHKPGSDVFEDRNGLNAQADSKRGRRTSGDATALKDMNSSFDEGYSAMIPLKEISTNSPPKSRCPSPQKKKSLFKTFDGNGSIQETEQEEHQLSPAAISLEPPVPTEIIPNVHSINGAIHDLLSKSRAQSNASSRSESSNQKKKLLGRALSNLSNSSIGTVRASRASSVDSMNTDGVGSEIAPETSQTIGGVGNSGLGTKSSFTGRAKPRDTYRGDGASMELGEMHHAEFYVSEELDVVPQQTQLGYEDSEEAVLLRKKLAERRRDQSRDGQADAEVENERRIKEQAAAVLEREPKRIKDDDALVGVGEVDGVRAEGQGRKTKVPKASRNFKYEGDVDDCTKSSRTSPPLNTGIRSGGRNAVEERRNLLDTNNMVTPALATASSTRPARPDLKSLPLTSSTRLLAADGLPRPPLGHHTPTPRHLTRRALDSAQDTRLCRLRRVCSLC